MKYPMTNKCKVEMLDKILNKDLNQDDYELMECEIMDSYGEQTYICNLDNEKELLEIINPNQDSYSVFYIDLSNKEEVIQEFLREVIGRANGDDLMEIMLR